MEHDEARERVCLTCFNFIPFDRKKKGKLQKNAINLLENESRLEMVLKLLPTYNVKDVRLPCALCKNCNRQLSFLSCENRNPSPPNFRPLEKFLKDFLDLVALLQVVSTPAACAAQLNVQQTSSKNLFFNVPKPKNAPETTGLLCKTSRTNFHPSKCHTRMQITSAQEEI